MTWKELKDDVESKGVKDEDQIEFIEVQLGSVMVVRDEKRGTVQIYDQY